MLNDELCKNCDTYIRDNQVIAKVEIYNLINKYLTLPLFSERIDEKLINRFATTLQKDINDYINLQRESIISFTKNRVERHKISEHLMQERKALEERDG